MKLHTKKILILTLFVLISMSTYSQDRWTIGVGYGGGQSFAVYEGSDLYLTGTYQLTDSWSITTRLSYIRSTSFFMDAKTITVQPEINWLIVKKPFILYPSFGVAVGKESYPSEVNTFMKEGFVWGPNVGLNLDVPFGRFSIGSRLSGNTLIQGNEGNAFLSLSGVVKFRFGEKSL